MSQLGTLLHENGYKLERTRCLNKEGPPPRLHVVGESEGDGVTLSLIGRDRSRNRESVYKAAFPPRVPQFEPRKRRRRRRRWR